MPVLVPFFYGFFTLVFNLQGMGKIRGILVISENNYKNAIFKSFLPDCAYDSVCICANS